ncbi:MAG: hypothetical protein ACRDKI_06225 [Solirubrobacterales bacterium]
MLTVLAATAAISVPAANASFTAPYDHRCSGASITGLGSSAQRSAQDAFHAFWRTNVTTRKTSGCGPASKKYVGYQVLPTAGPGAGSWSGFTGLGGYARFYGSDDAPTLAQRGAIEQRASHHGPAVLQTVPVAQTAQAVIVNFPKNCELRAGDPNLASYARFKVPGATLVKMWFGDAAYDTWGELLPGIKATPNTSRTDQSCRSVQIVRVMPGSLFSGAHVLLSVAASLQFGVTAGLHGIYNPLFVNDANPISVAQVVAKLSGSIAVVGLPAARAAGFQKAPDTAPSGSEYVYQGVNQQRNYPAFGNRYSFKQQRFWIPLEAADGAGNPTGSYLEPTFNRVSIRNGQRGANCRDVPYANVPLDAQGKIDVRGDWSKVTATRAANRYPLCVLSYVSFWDDYSDVYANSKREQANARTVRDYLTTTLYSGQHTLFKKDYTPLSWSPAQNLRFVGQRAILRSNWLKP